MSARLSHFREVKGSATRKSSLGTGKRGRKAEEQHQHVETVAKRMNSNADEPPEDEQILRAFDLTLKYGPCIGMTRLERWHRAHKFGLNPPARVLELLERENGSDNVNINSPIWAGRV